VKVIPHSPLDLEIHDDGIVLQHRQSAFVEWTLPKSLLKFLSLAAWFLIGLKRGASNRRLVNWTAMKPFYPKVKRTRRVKKCGKPPVFSSQKKDRKHGPKPSSLPPDEHAYIEAGHAVLALPHKTFEAWEVVGKAIQLLRLKANQVGTRGAFARLLDQHGFGEFIQDKATCTRLLRIMENLGEVAAWHASLEPKHQMAWAHPSTVFLHCPIFKKPKMRNAKKSLTALQAFEVMKKTAPIEFLDAFKVRDEVCGELQQRVIDWLNELARSGSRAALSRRQFGSAEGGGRLHSDFEKTLSNLHAPVGHNDTGATKPAFTPDVIEQLRTILNPVRERFGLGVTMERLADLVKRDRQELADLTQNMERGRGRPPDDGGRFAALLLAVVFDEFTGTLPGRSTRTGETDTKLRDQNSPFYTFCRAACDAIGINVNAALKEAIAELKGRGKLEANFPGLRKLLWGGLTMAPADYEQVRIHFSMALNAFAEGKLPSDVLSPGPPVQITVESALIDAVHLQEPLEDMGKDQIAVIVLRALRQKSIEQLAQARAAAEKVSKLRKQNRELQAQLRTAAEEVSKLRQAQLREVTAAQRGAILMDRAVYRTIRAALHPDRVGPELKRQYEEAFQVFSNLPIRHLSPRR
jgi:hypothetical protein